MILSAHIADLSVGKAISALRSRPDPEAINGLRYAQTWLMSPLRSGMLPSTDVTGVALIAAWDDDKCLDRFLYHPFAKVYERGWNARFEPVRTIGAWPTLPDLPRQEQPTDDEPVAVLTMARVRMNRFGAFAKAAGGAERDALHHPAYLEGTSLIRPPNLVATFSLWRNAREMRHYVVNSYPGGHAQAMKKHQEKVFHHETVFVRLRPYSVSGQWKGRNPLATVEPDTGSTPHQGVRAGHAIGTGPRHGEPGDDGNGFEE